ncbi:hypothetical protein TNCV_1433081 [Trichonephila clavipes]|nr:hypothetical protein TNCV_1433081 [Trichonephila clavipes]
MVSIHPGLAAKWAGGSSAARPSQWRYTTQKLSPAVRRKQATSLGVLQVPRNRINRGQGFRWLSKTLTFLCQGRILSMYVDIMHFGLLKGMRDKRPCPGSRELERRALFGMDLERALAGENLRRALRRLEWKGRKDDERPGGVENRR